MQGPILLESRVPVESGFSYQNRGLATNRQQLFRAVAVRDFHAIFRAAQVFADFLGDHDGAMLSSGATECYGQIALAFITVVRKQVYNHNGNALEKLLCMRYVGNVLGTQ